jgi:hypothetical protein
MMLGRAGRPPSATASPRAEVRLSGDALARIDRIIASAGPVVGPSPDVEPMP